MTEQAAQQLIVAFVPSFMSGIFMVISTILQTKLKNVPIQPTAIRPTTGVSHFVYFGKVLLHAGIVLLVATTAFFVVSVTTIYLGVSSNVYLSHFFLFRWIPYVLAFVWVAAKVERVIRWKHLASVAIIVAIIQIPIRYIYYAAEVIVMKGGAPPLTLGFEIFYIPYTLVQIFVSMGVGGAITNAMKPN